jgi:hypothetical protein
MPIMRSATRVLEKNWVGVGSRNFQSNHKGPIVAPIRVMRRLVTEGDYGAVCHELSSHKETHALLVKMSNGHEMVHDLGTEVDLGRRKDPVWPTRIVRTYPDYDSRMEVLRSHNLGNPEDAAVYLSLSHAIIAAHQLGGRLLMMAEWQALAADQADPFIFESLAMYKGEQDTKTFWESWTSTKKLWEWTSDFYPGYDRRAPSEYNDTNHPTPRGQEPEFHHEQLKRYERASYGLGVSYQFLGFRVSSLLP